MTTRTKTKGKDDFQKELHAALKTRGYNEPSDVSDEDDDYSDDFSDDNENEIEIRRKPLSPVQRDDYSDFASHNDKYSESGSSRFLKKTDSKQHVELPMFDPLNMPRREVKKPFGKQTAIDEDNESSETETEDPLLKLLQSAESKKKPVPLKRSFTSGKSSGGRSSSGMTSPVNELESQIPRRSQSPKQRNSFILSKGDEGKEMNRDQRSGRISPQGKNAPGRKTPVQISNTEHSEFEPPVDRVMPLKGRQSLHQDFPDISGSEDRLRGMHRKSPQSEKQTSDLKSILSTVKGEEAVYDQSSRQQRKKLMKGETVKSQSIVNFLLDTPPQPETKPEGSHRSKDSRITSPGRSQSPTIHEKKRQKDSLLEQKQIPSNRRDDRFSPHEMVTTSKSEDIFSLASFPSLQRTASAGMQGHVTANEKTVLPDGKIPKQTQQNVNTEADGLLALFDHAMKNDQEPLAHTPVQLQPKAKTPLEEVVQKTSEQKQAEMLKQRSTRQLLDNVIDNVAEHNESSRESVSVKDDTNHPRRQSTKSGKKSYRTPPVNYKGLGSLTGLKDLKKINTSVTASDSQPVCTEDIRKKAYQEWLAKRELETIKRKKEQEEIKKKDKEMKEKEQQDKSAENILVRKKWEEVKDEEKKEKLKVMRIQEKHKLEKEREKEEQKRKSEKQAEKRRQELLEQARIKHRQEKRKEIEEKRKAKKNESRNKKESERAMENWMNKRSEQWVLERKKDLQEKKRKENKLKSEKEKESKEAEEQYIRWRQQKDEQLKQSLREKRLKQRRSEYEDEAELRPAWSPASKVIPRQK